MMIMMMMMFMIIMMMVMMLMMMMLTMMMMMMMMTQVGDGWQLIARGRRGGVLSAVHLLGEGGGGGVVNVHTHVVPQLAVLLTTCLSAVPLTPPGFTQNVV